MAQAQLGNPLGVTDKRSTQGNTTSPIGTEANYADVAALRTRLAAVAAGTYTATVLDQMTVNDMIYALRVLDDAAGL